MMPKDLAKLVSRRFDILHSLYPDKELYISQLAQNLSQNLGNISRYVEELRQRGLIKVQERKKPKGGGKPRRFCALTISSRKILSPILETTKPKLEEKELQESQVNMLIDVLEDHNLTQDFRGFIAEKLSELAVRNATPLITQERVRDLFEQIVTNPPSTDKDKVGKHLLSCLSISIPQILVDDEVKEWFFSKIYKRLFTLMSHPRKEEKIRRWAMANISKVAMSLDDSNLRNKTIDRFLEIYFKDANGLSNAVKDELAKFKQKSQDEIIRKVRSETDKPEKRTKAEALLKELISLWLHTSTRPTQSEVVAGG